MRYYQKMWHPDKGFLRVFKHRIAPEEREEIEKRAMDVSAEVGVAKQFYKEAKEKQEEKEAKSGKAKTEEEEIADENNLFKTPTTVAIDGPTSRADLNGKEEFVKRGDYAAGKVRSALLDALEERKLGGYLDIVHDCCAALRRAQEHATDRGSRTGTGGDIKQDEAGRVVAALGVLARSHIEFIRHPSPRHSAGVVYGSGMAIEAPAEMCVSLLSYDIDGTTILARRLLTSFRARGLVRPQRTVEGLYEHSAEKKEEETSRSLMSSNPLGDAALTTTALVTLSKAMGAYFAVRVGGKGAVRRLWDAGVQEKEDHEDNCSNSSGSGAHRKRKGVANHPFPLIAVPSPLSPEVFLLTSPPSIYGDRGKAPWPYYSLDAARLAEELMGARRGGVKRAEKAYHSVDGVETKESPVGVRCTSVADQLVSSLLLVDAGGGERGDARGSKGNNAGGGEDNDGETAVGGKKRRASSTYSSDAHVVLEEGHSIGSMGSFAFDDAAPAKGSTGNARATMKRPRRVPGLACHDLVARVVRGDERWSWRTDTAVGVIAASVGPQEALRLCCVPCDAGSLSGHLDETLEHVCLGVVACILHASVLPVDASRITVYKQFMRADDLAQCGAVQHSTKIAEAVTLGLIAAASSRLSCLAVPHGGDESESGRGQGETKTFGSGSSSGGGGGGDGGGGGANKDDSTGEMDDASPLLVVAVDLGNGLEPGVIKIHADDKSGDLAEQFCIDHNLNVKKMHGPISQYIQTQIDANDSINEDDTEDDDATISHAFPVSAKALELHQGVVGGAMLVAAHMLADSLGAASTSSSAAMCAPPRASSQDGGWGMWVFELVRRGSQRLLIRRVSPAFLNNASDDGGGGGGDNDDSARAQLNAAANRVLDLASCMVALLVSGGVSCQAEIDAAINEVVGTKSAMASTAAPNKVSLPIHTLAQSLWHLTVSSQLTASCARLKTRCQQGRQLELGPGVPEDVNTVNDAILADALACCAWASAWCSGDMPLENAGMALRTLDAASKVVPGVVKELLRTTIPSAKELPVSLRSFRRHLEKIVASRELKVGDRYAASSAAAVTAIVARETASFRLHFRGLCTAPSGQDGGKNEHGDVDADDENEDENNSARGKLTERGPRELESFITFNGDAPLLATPWEIQRPPPPSLLTDGGLGDARTTGANGGGRNNLRPLTLGIIKPELADEGISSQHWSGGELQPSSSLTQPTSSGTEGEVWGVGCGKSPKLEPSTSSQVAGDNSSAAMNKSNVGALPNAPSLPASSSTPSTARAKANWRKAKVKVAAARAFIASSFKHRDDAGRRKLWVTPDTLHLIGIDGGDHNHGAHGGHPYGDRKVPSKLTVTLKGGAPQVVAIDHTEMSEDGSVCLYFNEKRDREMVLEWIRTERNANLAQHVAANGADRCEYVMPTWGDKQRDRNRIHTAVVTMNVPGLSVYLYGCSKHAHTNSYPRMHAHTHTGTRSVRRQEPRWRR